MIEILFLICVGLIIYIYFGFPLLLLVFVWIKELFIKSDRLTAGISDFYPSVTLLISAYNEEKIIEQKIRNSLELVYPESLLEIVVTADGSDDQTPEIVKSFLERGVKLLYHPDRRGKMAAINRAMPFTQGEIVVFSDANNMYHPDAIKELVSPFRDPKVGGTNGAKYIVEGDGVLGEAEGLYWRYESYIKKLETRLISSTAVAGEIFAIRKELFEPPPDNIINDDFFMAMRLVKRGYKVHYSHSAKSYERVSPTARDEVARRARINAGRYQAIFLSHMLLPISRPMLIWQVVSHKYFRLFVPFFMIGAFITNLILVGFNHTSDLNIFLTRPVAIIFLILQIMFYASSLIFSKFRNDNFLLKVLYLPTFLVNSNFAGLIGAVRYVTKKQSTKWERVSRRD